MDTQFLSLYTPGSRILFSLSGACSAGWNQKELILPGVFHVEPALINQASCHELKCTD
jgi:hypothetical protein